jgi:hypothetical protein
MQSADSPLPSTIEEMSDTLYLSLWYPNLRLVGLAEKLTSVLSAFAAHGGEARVYSSTVWPVNWRETPIFQQVYGRLVQASGAEGGAKGPLGALPREAVAETLETLHEDFAYEFQIGWNLWEIDGDWRRPGCALGAAAATGARGGLRPALRRWLLRG